MLEELWQPIEGFPNYEISNYGRVVNVRRGTNLRTGFAVKADDICE